MNKIIGFVADPNADNMYDLYRKSDQVYCTLVCGTEQVISLASSKKNGWTLHTFDSQLRNDWDGVHRVQAKKVTKKKQLVN